MPDSEESEIKLIETIARPGSHKCYEVQATSEPVLTRGAGRARDGSAPVLFIAGK
jgi:hypothetical protein